MEANKEGIDDLKKAFRQMINEPRDKYRDPLFQRIVRRIHKVSTELVQIYRDVQSWNDNSTARKSGAAPIDPTEFVAHEDVEWLEMTAERTGEMIRQFSGEEEIDG